jgi:DNA-binding FadR family transcriptional regulator
VSVEETTKLLVKPRVHQQVVERIARAILRGDYSETGYLPSEPQLCETLQVSRSALREAVRVLGSKGLVAPRPRVGTVVRPPDEWNMLDSELLAWSIEGKPDPKVVMALIEARQVFEPAAARLAALRATAADLAAIERAFLGMSAAREIDDFDAYNAADKDFHTAMLGASHNFVFRQLAKTIGEALAYSFRVTARELGHALPIHGEVMERIRMRDADGAGAAMLRLLDVAIHDLKQADRSPSARA